MSNIPQMVRSRSCCHCHCSTNQIGSKPLSQLLNVNLGGAATTLAPKDVHLKPTVLEALTLIFGFRMPSPEVVINTAANGMQYYDSKVPSCDSFSICINCESVLVNLYNTFLLFTEISNGRESLILKNAIISGRVDKDKEEEVIQLDALPFPSSNTTGYLDPTKQVTITTASSFTSNRPPPNLMRVEPGVTTIKRLTSDVIAEMIVPNQLPPATGVTVTPILNKGVTVTPILNQALTVTPIVDATLQNHNPGSNIPSLLTSATPPISRSNNTPLAARMVNHTNTPVEVITLDEDDVSGTNNATSAQSTGQRPASSSRLSTRSTTQKQTNPAGTALSRNTPQKPLSRPGVTRGTPQGRNQAPASLQRFPTTSANHSVPSTGTRTAFTRNGGTPGSLPPRPNCKRPKPSIPGTSSEHINSINFTSGCNPVSHHTYVPSLPQNQGGLTMQEAMSGIPHHKCNACPLSFPNLVTLLSHIYKDHRKPNVGKVDRRNPTSIPCPKCSIIFNDSTALAIHLRTQHIPVVSLGTRGSGLTGQEQLTGWPSTTLIDKHHKLGPETESDYWTTGIQVIHDPDHVMMKIEASAMEGRMKKTT